MWRCGRVFVWFVVVVVCVYLGFVCFSPLQMDLVQQGRTGHFHAILL